MKRRYKIEHDHIFDLSVTLEVDHSKLTPELATLINSFWTGADERLADADGDAVLAVVKNAAGQFMAMVLEPHGYNEPGMQREFDDQEGWPPEGLHGIRIVDYDGRPDLDHTVLTLKEVA